jgi:phospholipid/cholesterol/gamma-HCH transport system substrate-binding protein
MTNKKIQPAMIGVFVVLSCLLFVIAVIIFGGNKFFEKENIAIAYFEGSLKGLGIGAPVTYRGISIGQVKDIKISIQNNGENNHDITIPVLIALAAGKAVTVNSSVSETEYETGDFLKAMCEQGLRAKLKMQSLVTGTRYIDLAFYEDTVAVYRDQGGEYFEIPTLPSESLQLTRMVENINFEELYNKILNTFTSLESLTADLAKTLSDKKTQGLIDELSSATASLNSILTKIDSNVSPILEEIESSLQLIDGLAINADKVVTSFDSNLQPVIDDLSTLITHFNTTLQQADRVFQQAGKTLKPTSPLYFTFTKTMRQFEKTLNSIENLSDFLYRNPNALILGVQSTGDTSHDQ